MKSHMRNSLQHYASILNAMYINDDWEGLYDMIETINHEPMRKADKQCLLFTADKYLTCISEIMYPDKNIHEAEDYRDFI